MLTIERIKQLIGEPLTDIEAEIIRDYLRSQAELAFEQWQIERIKSKETDGQEQLKQTK